MRRNRGDPPYLGHGDDVPQKAKADDGKNGRPCIRMQLIILTVLQSRVQPSKLAPRSDGATSSGDTDIVNSERPDSLRAAHERIILDTRAH